MRRQDEKRSVLQKILQHGSNIRVDADRPLPQHLGRIRFTAIDARISRVLCAQDIDKDYSIR